MIEAHAMRRIHGPHGLPLAFESLCGEPRIGAAFGAMAMQDIDVEPGREFGDPGLGQPIGIDALRSTIVGRAPDCVEERVAVFRLPVGAERFELAERGLLGLRERRDLACSQRFRRRRFELADRLLVNVGLWSRALRVELSAAEKESLDRALTASTRAYELYAQANYLYTSVAPNEALARRLMESAVEADPKFAAALGWLAATDVLALDEESRRRGE